MIGNNADVDINLTSEDVSAIHCLIERRENGYFICDLGSQTGTFKNGQAILDESISSGDELVVGSYRLVFFIGVPKPQTVPSVNAAEPVKVQAPIVVKEVTKAVVTEPAPQRPEQSSMPPAAVAKVEQIFVASTVIPPAIPVEPAKAIEEKSVIAQKVLRPEIKSESTSSKKKKSKKTFAPPSEIQDLKSYLKPTKGSSIQIVVAWKERILTTYQFDGKKPVLVNSSGERSLPLPGGLFPNNWPVIDLTNGLRVNIFGDMNAELITTSGNQSFEDLLRNTKAQKSGQGHSVRVEQNEMLAIALPGGNLFLYIRFLPRTVMVPMLPPFMLSGTETAAMFVSFIMVGLLGLYVSATTPKDWQENKQEDVQRVAQIVFNKLPTPPPKVEVAPTRLSEPPPTPVTPPPDKKVVVADKNTDAQKKGATGIQDIKTQVAGRASEVAPKPLAKDQTKKFTSTRQGGAIKTGEKAGANAQSSNRDISKVGLLSSFGGGGVRANIDKAYTGASGVLGAANTATGTSGYNENRAGTDLGSKFKDSGAGGKGVATEGISGVGTKGKGSGQSAYGAADGFGSKNTVAIAGGGFEESFDATIDKEAVRRVIRAKLNEVKSCYERALNTLEKGKKLEGKVVLGWDIIEKGQARSVKIVSSTLDNPAVENCIRDRLASWVFPEPPAGMTAVVKAYPFVLNQQN